MKIKFIFLHRSASAGLTIYLLLAASLTTMAQTYKARLALTDAPAQLEASVFPLTSRPGVIKVMFNNLSRSDVRVMIRDEKGEVRYDAYESIAKYRRSFDLSELPAGSYTIELIKKREHVVRTFAINAPPPATKWITMSIQGSQDLPDLLKPTGKRLTNNP